MIKLKDVMTRDVLTVSPDLSIRDLMELLVARHVSGVPVVSGGKVVGVVSATDLMAFVTGLASGSSPDAPDEEPVEPTTEREEDVEREGEEAVAAYFSEMWSEDRSDVKSRMDVDTDRADVLDSHTVSEVMTRAPLCTMTPETSLDHAAAYMRRANVHRILVMTGDQLEGIVTTTDVTNAVADHQAVIRTFVFDRRTQLS